MPSRQSTLVLQSFGQENEYRRAVLTILSYYAHSLLPLERNRVILFTDKLTYFQPYLRELAVDYILLSPEKIKEMRGGINFLHRIKIAVIEEAFKIAEGNILYADSDTFFIADPTPLLQQIGTGKSFMHIWEYRFESLIKWTDKTADGKTFRNFLRLIESNEFTLADGSKVKYTPQHSSWNAGVMMFHPSHARFLPDVYALTDQFYPPTANHASEQYAFSLILQENTMLCPCNAVIYHYWYRVKKTIIDLFLEEKFNAGWSELPLAEKLTTVKAWCNHMPTYFERHVLTLKDNAVQAFSEELFVKGYQWAFKAMAKAPFSDVTFLKDILYYTRKKLWPSK